MKLTRAGRGVTWLLSTWVYKVILLEDRLEDKKDNVSYHEKNNRQEGKDNSPGSFERTSRRRQNGVNLVLEPLTHGRERELIEHPVPTRSSHTGEIRRAHLVQHGVDDICPGRDVVRVTQPARLALDDCLQRPAGVRCEHGDSCTHGFDGDDAEVFVDGRVEEETGLGEESVAEGRVDGGEEEDVDVSCCGQGRGDVVCRGCLETKRCG